MTFVEWYVSQIVAFAVMKCSWYVALGFLKQLIVIDCLFYVKGFIT